MIVISFKIRLLHAMLIPKLYVQLKKMDADVKRKVKGKD